MFLSISHLLNLSMKKYIHMRYKYIRYKYEKVKNDNSQFNMKVVSTYY